MRAKRLRGFGRHMRVHIKRAASDVALDTDWLEQHHYDYEKLGLAPWHVSDKPPLAIRKLWLGKLVVDFQQWHKQLKQQYADFYLAIWLFEPHFGDSQLVAGIEEQKAHYEGLFGEPVALSLPMEYQVLPGVRDLQWTALAYVTPFYPEDFASLGSWALKKPHWPTESPSGEKMIAVQIGVVWVGKMA
ncbi:hypothetical protein [Hymenobacter convexus]|uniref:hypothetical protein n=1 Tax=Hymenobacter sp. CA1UV-4 TaxID=3063782 RepID=UPI0027133C98|nr:hypothetical protein [Hymenobacter sp. CA1UV-4]MDO7850482.1 hypothetical protein [Hymenobacter sp. CA1UV-4]